MDITVFKLYILYLSKMKRFRFNLKSNVKFGTFCKFYTLLSVINKSMVFILKNKNIRDSK